jgi:hypothetical protein
MRRASWAERTRWMVALVAEHAEIGRTGLFLQACQAAPGLHQQTLTPLPHEDHFGARLDEQSVSAFRAAGLVTQGVRPFLLARLLPAPIIQREVPRRRLDQVAEASAQRIGAAKVAAQEAHAKLVGEFLRDVGVAEHAAQIEVDRPVVAQHQVALGRCGRLALTSRADC